jgi:hypothetical protein
MNVIRERRVVTMMVVRERREVTRGPCIHGGMEVVQVQVPLHLIIHGRGRRRRPAAAQDRAVGRRIHVTSKHKMRGARRNVIV